MNRTIKFRGQTNSGKWVYGSLIDDGVELVIIREMYVRPHLAQEWQVNPYTVGQFTGLTDKNGKEIYEGDTIKGGIYLSYDVEWDYEQNGWNIGCGVQSYYQVIGNIHDKQPTL